MALPLLALDEAACLGLGLGARTGERLSNAAWAEKGAARRERVDIKDALKVWLELLRFTKAATASDGSCNANVEPAVVEIGNNQRVCKFETDLHFLKFCLQMAICPARAVTDAPADSITAQVRARLDEGEQDYGADLALRYRELAAKSSSDWFWATAMTAAGIGVTIVMTSVVWVVLFCLLLVLCGYAFNAAKHAGERAVIQDEHAAASKNDLLKWFEKRVASDEELQPRATALWDHHHERVEKALLAATGAVRYEIEAPTVLPPRDGA